MASDHNYSITFLRTHLGYLTKTGFTQDINSKDIALLPSNSFGKWSTMLRRIEKFCNFYHLRPEIFEELQRHVNECETICFYCIHGTYCNECIFRKDCEFWNGDRKKLKLYKLF